MPRAPRPLNADDGYSDERVAARYDDSSAEMFAPEVVEPVVDFLVELAVGSRRAGRARHGIELSKAIVARLRAKPGGDAIDVTIGDFATTTVDGTFSVAYLVLSTAGSSTSRFPSATHGPRSSTCWRSLPA
jgi:hypothetical protein